MKFSQLRNIFTHQSPFEARSGISPKKTTKRVGRSVSSKSDAKATKHQPKTDVNRWLSVSLDILELHFIDLVVKPFLTGFGVLFGFGIALAVLLSIVVNYSFSNYFDFLILSSTISIVYSILITLLTLVLLCVHALITRDRFHTIHDIIPHHKKSNPTRSLFLILSYDVSFLISIYLVSLLLPYVASSNYFTFWLIAFTIIILCYRTLFRYVLPLMLFENFSFFKSIRESVALFFGSEIKILSHSIVPIVSILGIAVASSFLVEQTQWGATAGLAIAALYIALYYLYYFFFGFTIDYLAYVYTRIKNRIEPRVFSQQPYPSYRSIQIVSILLIIISPLALVYAINTSGQQAVEVTQELLITSKLQNERPAALNTQSTIQPFSSNDIVNYRDLEFSTNSISIATIESQEFSKLCLLNLNIKNNSNEEYEFFPHLVFNLTEAASGQKLAHYYEKDAYLSKDLMLDPYAKYSVLPGLLLRGSLSFDCSTLTSTSDVKIKFVMARVTNTAPTSNLTIDQYLDFENQIKAREFSNASMEMVLKRSDFDTLSISQRLPLSLEVTSAQIVNELDSRFCRVTFVITNKWVDPLEIEFYMISFTDSTGTTRPQVYINGQFNPEAVKGVIAPDYKVSISQDFNCQDGGSNYTLSLTPYIDFGPYVTETSTSVPVVIQ